MSNIVDPSLTIGSEFYNLLAETDSKNGHVDDAVEKYLRDNPMGLSFSYKKREYVLSNNPSTGNAQLHEIKDGQLILRDPHVQINSKYTPDGSIEIGGLVQAGSRVYIMKSGEDIVAFGSEDGWTVDQDQDNAIILYSGKKEEEVPPASSQNPPTTVPNSNNNPPKENDVTKPDNNSIDPTSKSKTSKQTIFDQMQYINAAKLSDGEYISKDGILFDSNGQKLGKSWYGNGTFRVKENLVYRKETLKDGSVVYLNINEHAATFSINKPYINESGNFVEFASYEFLREQGIATYDIDLPYVFPSNKSNDDSTNTFYVKKANDDPSVNLITTGTGDTEKVIGVSPLKEGTYIVIKNPDGNNILYMETELKNGTTVYLPINKYTGNFSIDQQFINEKGQYSQFKLSYDFLIQHGITGDDIDLPRIFRSSVT